MVSPEGKALGDAFVAWHASFLTGLNLVSYAWSKQMCAEPTYPENPYRMCPLLRLRLQNENISPGKYSGSANVSLSGTLWYYRRQVVGEAHQVMLLQDLETIITPLFGVWRPAPMTNTVSGGLYTVRSANSTIHDEMRHEFDDPNLRVSVASIALTIEGSVMVQNS